MNAYVIALLAAAQPIGEPNASPQIPAPQAQRSETTVGVSTVEDQPETSNESVDTVPAAPKLSEPLATDARPSDSGLERDPRASEATRRAEATKEVRRADALFREAQYDEALRALDEAESLWPDPAHHFMRGTIEKRRGDCRAAKRAFERFLDQNPPALDAEVARGQIQECQDQRPAMTLIPTFEAETPDSPPPTPAKSWIRDVPAGVLLGVGVAGTTVGAGFLVANRRDTETPTSYDEYMEIGSRRDRRRRIGTGLVIASSTLVAASIIRYVWVGRRARRARDRPTVALFAPQHAGSTALLRW